MESFSCSTTKRTCSQAFPEQWARRHSKRLKTVDDNLLPEEKLLEREIHELESRWDVLDAEAQKIYESIGAVYDTLRRRIRAFPIEDDNIAVDMSYREGISMAR